MSQSWSEWARTSRWRDERTRIGLVSSAAETAVTQCKKISSEAFKDVTFSQFHMNTCSKTETTDWGCSLFHLWRSSNVSATQPVVSLPLNCFLTVSDSHSLNQWQLLHRWKQCPHALCPCIHCWVDTTHAGSVSHIRRVLYDNCKTGRLKLFHSTGSALLHAQLKTWLMFSWETVAAGVSHLPVCPAHSSELHSSASSPPPQCVNQSV